MTSPFLITMKGFDSSWELCLLRLSHVSGIGCYGLDMRDPPKGSWVEDLSPVDGSSH